MRCDDIRQQLAYYRELDIATRAKVDEHLSACSACAAARTAYERMDAALVGLPTRQASRALRAKVLARTVQRSSAGPRRMRVGWAPAAAALVLLLAVVMGGTLRVSAEALPGDALYPVKRAAEQVRLTLTFDPLEREALIETLNETRRQEVAEVIRQQRDVPVEFQGTVQAVRDDRVLVDGLEVKLPPLGPQATPPALGSTVLVRALASAGQLEVAQIELRQPSTSHKPADGVPTHEVASPMPQNKPTEMDTVVPTRTLHQPTASVTIEPRPTRTLEIIPATLMATPSLRPDDALRPSRTPWHTQTPHNSRTPAIKPTIQPTSVSPVDAKPSMTPVPSPIAIITRMATAMPEPTAPPVVDPTSLPEPTATRRATPRPTLTERPLGPTAEAPATRKPTPKPEHSPTPLHGHEPTDEPTPRPVITLIATAFLPGPTRPAESVPTTPPTESPAPTETPQPTPTETHPSDKERTKEPPAPRWLPDPASTRAQPPTAPSSPTEESYPPPPVLPTLTSPYPAAEARSASRR